MRRPATILEIRKKNLPSSPTRHSDEQQKMAVQKFLLTDLHQIFVNSETTHETFEQSGKQNPIKNTLKRSANMWESTSSHSLVTTIGIQSGVNF